MDVAYMYNWDRAAPMRFSYRYTTKRPLGAEPPEPAASPSKRRCPAPADDRHSGTDSDKENVENDARPEPLDGVTPVAVTATAAAAAASAAPKPPAERQPPVGARLEGPREPMTSSRPAAPAGGQPSAVPPSPRRSLASLPALRPIGAGAIPLMTGQLDQFLWLVSQSAVSHPNGSWRLPADASALLSRATAPSQPAVTIEKIRAAPASQPQPARPPNSPKLLAIAESLAMKQIQAAAGKTPPPVSAAPTPSALGSLLSLSQSQQLGVSRQPSAGDQSAARCRPVSGSAARRQIPNPALLHQQSQGRLTVLNVPPAEAAGTGSGSGSSTSAGSLARMERLTNSLGR
ncbi:hypothetical protein FJT64_015128 [Amphibalanus amphitrite]|uniref:Uncharacterized protein n=1 Tax=Amphibalanus amphitrite TaxID=1232801 RepID=A0A6A4XDJ9_AMPAM|nr:hypothetical protein FJT64_015128 [Amphibalanus amphitrite]